MQVPTGQLSNGSQSACNLHGVSRGQAGVGAGVGVGVGAGVGFTQDAVHCASDCLPAPELPIRGFCYGDGFPNAHQLKFQ